MPKDKQHTTPLVSVVMATYNGQTYLKEAIDSILNQTFADFEFIIVNDGSSDNTEQIVKSYDDKRIVYIKKENNSGIADSLNIGIAAAKGQYVARMDDDDISYPDRFKCQLEAFSKNSKLIVCSTSVDDNNRTISIQNTHQEILIRLLFHNPIFHPSVMIIADILKANNYNPKYVPAEDYELWSRLIFKGEFLQLKTPLLFIRRHTTSVTVNNRSTQLQIGKDISLGVLKKVGFKISRNQIDSFSKLLTNDYNISINQLKKINKCVNNLVDYNFINKFFNTQFFKRAIEDRMNQFLISYFNQSFFVKKILIIVVLNFKSKYLLYNYYIRKMKRIKSERL